MNRLLLVMLLAISVIICTGWTATAQADNILGDANCDGSIDIGDPVFIIRAVMFGAWPPSCDICKADANGDCSVDISDAVYLLAYIFQGGTGPKYCGTPCS
jgi:hypothetical protein